MYKNINLAKAGLFFKKKQNGTSGFTIVELLIVIAIIGILAAIIMISYTGVTAKADEVSIKAELSNAAKKLSMYYTEYGSYPTTAGLNSSTGWCPTTPNANNNYCIKLNNNTITSYNSSSVSNYDLIATKNNKSYKINESSVYSVSEASSLPVVSSPTASSVGYINATLGANVTSDGGGQIIERGTCWGVSSSPTTNCVAEGGITTGVFSHVRNSMSMGTLVYFRGYAINSKGVAYSADSSFTTASTCFLAGTMVGTPNGDVAIEDLKPGDEVWSSIGGVSNKNIVIEVYERETVDYYKLDTNVGSLFVTGNHPILTRFGYQPVEKLKIGDTVLSKNGSASILNKLYINKAAKVYNLHVGAPNNYFANGIIVHNAVY